MSDTERPLPTIALIHSTSLPHPLGVLSKAISTFSKDVCLAPNPPAIYQIQILNLANYNIPTSTEADSSSTSQREGENEPSQSRKSATEWEAEISKHSGLIFLFPYHTWSHCSTFKSSISVLPQHVLTRKPVMLMGFGKEEPHDVNDPGRTWKKKSFGMMKEFLEGRNIEVIETTRGMPEFMVYADYWEHWITGGYNAFIGGQQAEAWESPAWDRCVEGMRMMMKHIVSRRK